MSGQSRLDGNAGRFLISHLADENNVGVLAQKRAQGGGEREPGLFVHLNLSDVAEEVFDRILDGENLERVAAEAPRAELVMYPEGNHVCNNIPYKYRPLVADWVWERLTHAR